nr:Alpha/beta hydrolase of uncharacterised function (DUF1023) [Streptococcus thermophilus]
MLVTSELVAAASSLRSARTSALSRIDDTAQHRTSLSSRGFDGPAATAGLSRLADLGRAFDGPADQMDAVAEILDVAAAAQNALDMANEVLSTVIVPPAALAAHRAAVIGMSLAARMLDQACATAISGTCLPNYEADLDRLHFHPDESLTEISARHMDTAPASVRAAIEDADGLLLEAGPGGYTVMVGPRSDVGDGGAGDLINPGSVTTMVSGVSSGTPEKLPRAIEEAQNVADATGGAVIVWQGYAPPPDVPTGINPSAARAGADDLAMFQMELEERYPDARKIVIGHSYGSVVATRAAMDHGLFADDLVLAGSPGVPTYNANELTLVGDNPQVTVVDSPTDPIRALRGPLAAAHGYNPSSPFFGADELFGVRGYHTDYFEDAATLEGLGRMARR